MGNPTQYLDYSDIADLAGMQRNSVVVAAKRARKRRDAGTATPADFPEPDVVIGSDPQYSRPGWRRSTIEKWIAARG